MCTARYTRRHVSGMPQAPSTIWYGTGHLHLLTLLLLPPLLVPPLLLPPLLLLCLTLNSCAQPRRCCSKNWSKPRARPPLRHQAPQQVPVSVAAPLNGVCAHHAWQLQPVLSGMVDPTAGAAWGHAELRMGIKTTYLIVECTCAARIACREQQVQLPTPFGATAHCWVWGHGGCR